MERAVDHEGLLSPACISVGPITSTTRLTPRRFALFARMQGAMAAGREFRAFVSCKTHAATDVLLGEIVHVQGKLRSFNEKYPDIVDRYFDARLLDVPLFRLDPREAPPVSVRALYRKEGGRRHRDRLQVKKVAPRRNTARQ